MPKRRTKDFDLPPRCERRYKSGRISYLPPTGGRIGFDLPPNPTVGQIWAEYDRITKTDRPHSLKNLFKVFAESEDYKKYSERTVQDHQSYMMQLDKVFANADMSAARPEHILRWRNKKAQTAKSQANKQLSFLRIVLQYAVSIGLLKSNPAKEVAKLGDTRKEKLRKKEKHYKQERVATVDKIAALYKISPPMLQIYLELRFCLGVRQGDLLRCRWADVHNDYITFVESKTTKWFDKQVTDRVRNALERSRRIEPLGDYVIRDRKGQNYKVNSKERFGTFESWFNTYRNKLPEHLQFTNRSLRNAAITEAQSNELFNAQDFSQHASASMVKHYDTSIPKSPSH
jgi:integrase